MTGKKTNGKQKTGVRSTGLVCRDDDGNRVGAGDTVRFRYGIPPVRVVALVVQRGKSLIALTPDHKPPECNLRSLRRYVGEWFKHTK